MTGGQNYLSRTLDKLQVTDRIQAALRGLDVDVGSPGDY
jgi:hypothetical protein